MAERPDVVVPAGTPSVVIAPLAVRAADAAKLLGISERTFERLHADRRLPEPCRLGRARVWPVAQLQAFVASGCRPPAREDPG